MPSQPKPRKPGRPKLPKGEAKVAPLQVRLNPEDRKRFEAAAKSSQQKLSEWIRNTLNAALEA